MATTVETHLLETIRFEFARQKQLADKAIAQLSDDALQRIPAPDTNSCAIVVQHMAGNLLSRWSDFLTSDGEKDWRNRDAEFEQQALSRTELMEQWEMGWKALFTALDTITPEHLLKHVYIRREPLTVLQALMRQVGHYGYHVGQIVTLARLQVGDRWQTLSIAKGQSKQAAQAGGTYLKS